jgi:hypothetical protein
MPESEVYETQVGILLEYIHKTVGTDHYSPGHGYSARTIAKRLSQSVREQGDGYLKLGSEVRGIRKEGEEVVVELGNGDGEIRVDRVVLATPASVAGKMLGVLEDSLEGSERDRVGIMKGALKSVRYKVSLSPSFRFLPAFLEWISLLFFRTVLCRNLQRQETIDKRRVSGKADRQETIVITHRDSSILPPSADIRDINLIHPSQTSSPSSSSSMTSTKSRTRSKEGTPHFEPEEGYTMATHVMRPPTSSRSGDVYQTTNPCLAINPDLVLGTALLERYVPLYPYLVSLLPFRIVKATSSRRDGNKEARD